MTKKDVFEFSQKDLKGKCISLHESQFQDLMFIYPLKRFAVAIFIVFGSSLFVIPESFAQEMSAIIKQEDFVNVNGRVVDKKGNGVEHVRAKIYYQDGEKVYTQTDSLGFFKLIVKRDFIGFIELSWYNYGNSFEVDLQKGHVSYDIGEVTLIKRKRKTVRKGRVKISRKDRRTGTPNL